MELLIPVFNEEKSILPLHQKLVAVLEGLGLDFGILFVDDGSTDETKAVIQELAQKDERVRIHSYQPNQGKSLALTQGFAMVKAEVIITMDGDLQDEPKRSRECWPNWRRALTWCQDRSRTARTRWARPCPRSSSTV